MTSSYPSKDIGSPRQLVVGAGRTWPHLAGVLGLVLLGGVATAAPQQNQPAGAERGATATPDEETVEVVAGPRYGSGGLHRLFFGDGYRDLWTTPIRVEVLDMDETGGGLTAEFRVGGAQTQGLALSGADGRSYTFRAVDKDPTSILPPELQGTPFEKIVQDQISSSFPGAPLVANPLARAVGVPQVEARLVVLPDDERLGEFREDFAGLFGTFEEYPQPGPDGAPGTFGAVELVDGRDMFARITAGWDTRVDTAQYLRARLLDLVLGDWDRHVEQWRYARFPGRELWQPIPEDRDQAFSRYDGLVMAMARDREPKFDVFGADYTPLEGLTWNARQVDRRLLVDRVRADFVTAAREIQAALSDEVIADAVRKLPEPYLRVGGERLESALRARRDELELEAEKFYEFLAAEVDVRTTNEAELVQLSWSDAGNIHMAVHPLSGESGVSCEAPVVRAPAVIEREFDPAETDELRLYLGDGNDRVVFAGLDDGSLIRVRVIGGGGTNLLCHADAGNSWTFGLESTARSGPGVRVARGVWLSPGETIEAGGTPPEQQGPAATARRDWGKTMYRVPWVGVSPDIGIFLGTGIIWEHFGFRQRPFASRHQLRAGFAFGAGRPRVDYEGQFSLENRRTHFRVRALYSGIETINFFGFGNDTVGDEEEFFRVHQTQFALEPRVVFPFGGHGWISTGPTVRYVAHDDDDTVRLIDIERPYGVEGIGQVGWGVGISYDNREFPGTRDIKATDDLRRMGPPSIGPGVSFEGDARYHAERWGLRDDYLAVEGAASGWLHFGQFAPAVGLRVGGKKVFGDAPYYDAATLGGRELRGLPVSRFTGDAVLHANLGLLLSVSEVHLVVPGRMGLLAHAGSGRVWLEGESSDTWHWSYGAGIWWAPWTMSTAVRVGVADSDEGTAVYFVTGFGF